MEFQVKTTPKVKQFRFQITVPFIKKTFRTIIQYYRSPDTWTYGMTSRCQDGKHILFFDYDHMGLKEIIDEIEYLQEYYSLSHAYIFELDRNKSYHVVILDKFSLKDAYEIQSQSNTEWAYLNSVRFTRGREWVLRIAEKGNRNPPHFLKVIKSKNQEHQISKAHKNFLQKYEHYAVPKLSYKKEDTYTRIPIVKYNTGNRVDEKDLGVKE